jgi:hypothetical protein
MTPLKINKLIAESEGLSVKESGDCVLYRPGGIVWINIDYTTDWNLCGPLEERLGPAGWRYCYASRNEMHRWENINTDKYAFDEDLKTSICLAYIEEFVNDKNL